jgi:hypothetical protein
MAAKPKDLVLSNTFHARTLSAGEYYHSCVSSYKKSYDLPRESTLILEGHGDIDAAELQKAINNASAVNPGSHLKLRGDSFTARWSADGEFAQVREINNSEWDGRSSKGASFIYAKPLLIRQGISCELIIARNNTLNKSFLIFRNLHAVMDGIGCMHFLREVFRSLKGEPLLGSNASFKETDLMQFVGGLKNEQANFKLKPAYATGGVEGDEIGDSWQRVIIEGPIPWILARVSGIVAEHATSLSDRVARIAVPVNLRRHMPDIRSTMNYSYMLHVDLKKGEGMAHFQKRLHKALNKKSDAHYTPLLGWAKLLPMSWMDKLLCRNKKNYLSDRIFETAVISDLGVFKSSEFSYKDFQVQDLYGVPVAGNTFCLLSAMDNRVSITLGMPKVYASNGRLSQLINLIKEKLSSDD